MNTFLVRPCSILYNYNHDRALLMILSEIWSDGTNRHLDRRPFEPSANRALGQSSRRPIEPSAGRATGQVSRRPVAPTRARRRTGFG